MAGTRAKTKGEDTTARILSAAASVFAQDGYAGARVDEIARRARINKAMLYYHVGNKADLYETVLLDWMDTLFTSLEARVASLPDPEAKLRALAETFEELIREHREYPQILVREFSTGGQNLSPEVIGRLVTLFAFEGEILKAGRKAGVFRPAGPLTIHILLVVGTVMHLMGRQLLERAASLGFTSAPAFPDSPSRAVADLVLNGLKTSAGDRPTLPAAKNRGGAPGRNGAASA